MNSCKECKIFAMSDVVKEDWMMSNEDWRLCKHVYDEIGLVEAEQEQCSEFKIKSHEQQY